LAPQDWAANDRALADGDRLLSAYLADGGRTATFRLLFGLAQLNLGPCSKQLIDRRALFFQKPLTRQKNKGVLDNNK